LLSAIRAFNVKKDFGVWAPACIQHGFIGSNSFTSQSYEIPAKNGITISDAIKKFIENPISEGNIHIDVQGWPSNSGCSGMTGKLQFLRH
jgi:hypothetical protein